MRYEKIYLFVAPLLALLIVLFCYIFFIKVEKEIYYVNSKYLFENFKMTLDTQRMGEENLKKMQLTIDSLENIISSETDETIKSHSLKKLIESKQFLESYQRSFSEIEQEKIWKRIKVYLENYPLTKKSKLIIGSQYSGEVLFVDSKYDVTEDLLHYINKRYEGYN